MRSYFSYIGKVNSPRFFWNDILDAKKWGEGRTPGAGCTCSPRKHCYPAQAAF